MVRREEGISLRIAKDDLLDQSYAVVVAYPPVGRENAAVFVDGHNLKFRIEKYHSVLTNHC